jgi:hypothetical protein
VTSIPAKLSAQSLPDPVQYPVHACGSDSPPYFHASGPSHFTLTFSSQPVGLVTSAEIVSGDRSGRFVASFAEKLNMLRPKVLDASDTYTPPDQIQKLVNQLHLVLITKAGVFDTKMQNRLAPGYAYLIKAVAPSQRYLSNEGFEAELLKVVFICQPKTKKEGSVAFTHKYWKDLANRKMQSVAGCSCPDDEYVRELTDLIFDRDRISFLEGKSALGKATLAVDAGTWLDSFEHLEFLPAGSASLLKP